MNGRTYPEMREVWIKSVGPLMSYLLLEKSDTKLSVSMACLKCFLPMTLVACLLTILFSQPYGIRAVRMKPLSLR